MDDHLVAILGVTKMSIDRNHFSDRFVVFTILLGLSWVPFMLIILYLRWFMLATYWFIVVILMTVAWNLTYKNYMKKIERTKEIELDDMTIEIDKDWEAEEIK